MGLERPSLAKNSGIRRLSSWFSSLCLVCPSQDGLFFASPPPADAIPPRSAVCRVRMVCGAKVSERFLALWASLLDGYTHSCATRKRMKRRSGLAADAGTPEAALFPLQFSPHSFALP